MSGAGRSRTRVVRRLGLAAALALLGTLLVAAPASAHATLIGTDPTEGQVLPVAPATATFTFDEPVRSSDDGVHLFDATGTELDADAGTKDTKLVVELPDDLADGTYVVAWRVVSSDGHPIAGALTFSVGAPSENMAKTIGVASESPRSVRVALGIVQALTYLGVFGACGLVVFAVLLLPRTGGVEQVRARLGRLAVRSAWVAVGAGFATVVVTALYQQAEGFSALFGDSPFEVPGGDDLLSWALTSSGVAVAVLGLRRATTGPAAPAYAERAALGGVVLALAALGLVGHTRAYPPLWLMLVTDLTHVAAGAVWFGGLVGLVISLRRLSDRPRLAAEVLGRFSGLAAWLLLGVALTGSVLGWRILKSWDNLVGSDFGRVLLVKIGLVALVALVAAWNRYRLMPAVLADTGFADRGAAAGRMRRVVRVEALLLVGVLGLTGFLVDRTPVEDTGPIALPGALDDSTYVGQFGKVKVVTVVEPASVGRNTVVLQLQDTAGDPVEPLGVPVLSLTEGSLALGDAGVTNVDSGTYRATVVIPRPGTWTLQVSVPLSEFDSPVVSVKVPVGG